MHSPDAPLTGGCVCGAVAFEVTAPFDTAGYCHCKRCQRRSGALWSMNAIVGADGLFALRDREVLAADEGVERPQRAAAALAALAVAVAGGVERLRDREAHRAAGAGAGQGVVW